MTIAEFSGCRGIEGRAILSDEVSLVCGRRSPHVTFRLSQGANDEGSRDASRPKFGQRVAEDEGEALAAYFVETDHWRRLYADEIDVVYGPKGSGKSALYSLLISRSDELFDRAIIAAAPSRCASLQGSSVSPPASEREFIALWKLYFACLASDALDQWGVSGASAARVRASLHAEGLVRGTRTSPRASSCSSRLRASSRSTRCRRGECGHGTLNYPKDSLGRSHFASQMRRAPSLVLRLSTNSSACAMKLSPIRAIPSGSFSIGST